MEDLLKSHSRVLGQLCYIMAVPCVVPGRYAPGTKNGRGGEIRTLDLPEYAAQAGLGARYLELSIILCMLAGFFFLLISISHLAASPLVAKGLE